MGFMIELKMRWEMTKEELRKKIFIIVGIWFSLAAIIAITDELWRYLDIGYKDILYGSILGPIADFIAFIPTIFLLYQLFKKFENKFIRVLLTAFLIPFTNLIYFYAEALLKGPEYSLYIGYFAVFVTLPVIFLTALCTPKSVLPIKWYVILTDILMAIFGWIMIMICPIWMD